MEPEIRETALWVATELAYTTGMNEYEIQLLEKYIQGMDIDRNIAEKIGQVIPIKFRVWARYYFKECLKFESIQVIFKINLR